VVIVGVTSVATCSQMATFRDEACEHWSAQGLATTLGAHRLPPAMNDLPLQSLRWRRGVWLARVVLLECFAKLFAALTLLELVYPEIAHRNL
jgi:hypothetical protein